jgi:Fe-S cluster assembly protein SufD
VSAERGSRSVVVLDHVSVAENATGLTNSVIEVFVEAGARLDLVLMQREGQGLFHVSSIHTRQDRDSHLTTHTLTVGGGLVRNQLTSRLLEEGASVRLQGLFASTGSQHVDNQTLVEHAAPHCSSRQLYKGVLGGRSRGVFRGRVVVSPGAQKTDAEQSSRNLLLTDHAEIDTKPQLEIYADDVKCSHGSSIGQLDTEALFYLRARGLAEKRARALLTEGFVREIVAGLPGPDLVARGSSYVDAILHGGNDALLEVESGT